MRWAALALLAASCTAEPGDGLLKCSAVPAHACPSSYSCVDGRCYRAGHMFEDMTATVGGEDMAAPPTDLDQLADLAATADLSMATTTIDDDFVGSALDPATWTSLSVALVDDTGSGATTAVKIDTIPSQLNYLASQALPVGGDFDLRQRVRVAGVAASSSLLFGLRGNYAAAFAIPPGATGWQVLIGSSIVTPNGTSVAIGTAYSDFEIHRSGTAITMSINGVVLHTTTAAAMDGDVVRLSAAGTGTVFVDRVTFQPGK